MKRFVWPLLVAAVACQPLPSSLHEVAPSQKPDNPNVSSTGHGQEPTPTPTPPPPAQSRRGALKVMISASLDTPARSDAVARVRFELSGANLAQMEPIEIPSDRFIGGRASAIWEPLPVGPVHLKAVLFDGFGRQLGVAEQDAIVEQGKTAEFNLTVEVAAGTAIENLDPELPTPPPARLSLIVSRLSPGTWEPFASLAFAPSAPSAVRVAGKVLVLEEAGRSVQYLDLGRELWVPVTSSGGVEQVPAGRAAELGGRLALLPDAHEASEVSGSSGGWVDDVLSPAGNELKIGPFTQLPSGHEPRTYCGVASYEGRVYLAGGSSRRHLAGGTTAALVVTGAFERLSPESGHWAIRTAMPTPRAPLGQAGLGGKLFAAGGFRWEGDVLADPVTGRPGIDASTAFMQPLRAFEVYDPQADAWSSAAEMPSARHSLALAASRGRIYAIGGANASGAVLSTVESYDPGAGSWRQEAPLSNPRAMPAAAVLDDGTILIIGGRSPNGRPLHSVEAFVPRDAQ